MKRWLIILALSMSAVSSVGQIRNRLEVSKEIFLKYADGRIKQYDVSNILLADSLYRYGDYKNDSRVRMLALSLELPPRFIQNDTLRIKSIVAELKSMADYNHRMREFYFVTMYDYCNMLINAGRISDAMLEARDMASRASEAKSNAGNMYAHRIIGLIQSYRTNSELAIRNFRKAADYCVLAKDEQELPGIYILIAREMIRLKRYDEVERYCSMAEEYQDFYPTLKVLTLMTKAYLYEAKDDAAAFGDLYSQLNANPLYRVQTDMETRMLMDICWLRSNGSYDSALSLSDSLRVDKDMYEQKQYIYALKADYRNAYENLNNLMAAKDSIYITVQNEDMAILDAELNNAQLRLEAQRLKAQKEMYIMFGIIFLFILVSGVILFTQWNLNITLEDMRRRNKAELEARNAYRRAIDAKELENEMKTRILQKRQNSSFI